MIKCFFFFLVIFVSLFLKAGILFRHVIFCGSNISVACKIQSLGLCGFHSFVNTVCCLGAMFASRVKWIWIRNKSGKWQQKLSWLLSVGICGFLLKKHLGSLFDLRGIIIHFVIVIVFYVLKSFELTGQKQELRMKKKRKEINILHSFKGYNNGQKGEVEAHVRNWVTVRIHEWTKPRDVVVQV